MARYRNGEAPLSALVRLGECHYLPPSTAAQWLALKQYVWDKHRVRINILPGWNAYRPRANQAFARQQACARGRCQDAAVVGTSSHGLEYIYVPGTPGDPAKYKARHGQDCAAIDVTGYQALKRDDWYTACRLFGFEPGFFDWEPWHIIAWDCWAPVPASLPGASEPARPKEIAVKTYHTEDGRARRDGRKLNAGDGFYLHRYANAGTDKATNIAHLVGPYTMTAHVYAEGKPGDALELKLIWANDTGRRVRSPHYIERMVFDRKGLIRRSVTFQRAVNNGDAVFVRLEAAASNVSPARVTLLDADAYLFTVAP